MRSREARGVLRRKSLAVLIAAAAVAACERGGPTTSTGAHAPAAIADQECAVCGMLVAEQTAPRGQVFHRDGTHLFFCSVGDLLAYLDVPSPHGHAAEIFVERMQPDEDPESGHTGEHPWIRAQDASYVVGVRRPRVMGEPVLVYGSREEADQVARPSGARVLDFDQLGPWRRSRP